MCSVSSLTNSNSLNDVCEQLLQRLDSVISRWAARLCSADNTPFEEVVLQVQVMLIKGTRRVQKTVHVCDQFIHQSAVPDTQQAHRNNSYVNGEKKIQLMEVSGINFLFQVLYINVKMVSLPENGLSLKYAVTLTTSLGIF